MLIPQASSTLKRRCWIPFSFQSLGIQVVWQPLKKLAEVTFRILVYPNKEYATVTISVNNFVTCLAMEQVRQKNSQKMGIKATPGEFTLLFLQFYQSFSMSFIEIRVHLNFEPNLRSLMLGEGKTNT